MVLLGGGITVLSPVVWAIVLVRRTMPQALHEVVAVTLRYHIRFTAYAWMLTGAYPRGAFGDPAAPEPPDAEESPLASPVPPLTLSRGAKRLVAVVLVLGAVYLAGGGYADVKLRQPSRTAGERTAVARDYEQLAVSMSLYAQGVERCKNTASEKSCIDKLEPMVVTALDVFAGQLEQVDLIGSPRAEADMAARDSREMAAALKGLSQAISTQAYVQSTTRGKAAAERLNAAMDRASRAVAVTALLAALCGQRCL